MYGMDKEKAVYTYNVTLFILQEGNTVIGDNMDGLGQHYTK